MALEVQEIEMVIQELTKQLKKEILIANITGELENVLTKYGYRQEKYENFYYDKRNAKIIVIGEIQTKEKEVLGCLKSIGIDKQKVEFYTDYHKLKNTNFSFLRNNANYSDILVCAMPHKMAGITGYNSFVSMVEENPKEFPTLTRIGKMKYSNSAFKEALLKTNYYRNIVNREGEKNEYKRN